MMDLLTNAIESIQVGVEDYQVGTRPRLLSAVRNIHAGILLLFKNALREVSPPDSNNALMMAVIAPFRSGTINRITFVGTGYKTATVGQIKERFKALGMQANWERFDRINRTRNEVEHLFPQLDQKGLRGLIADSFLVMRNFIRDELFRNPWDVLGQKTWQAMLEVAEVYEKDRVECDELVAKATWRSVLIKAGVQKMACPKCASGLLEPFEDSDSELWLDCRSCGSNFSPSTHVPWAVMTELAAEEIEASREGRERLYSDCPSCGHRAYVVAEKQCAMCQFVRGPKCIECGDDLQPEEISASPVCRKCSSVL
jgi:ribosomal protein L37AE/L43A